jgi:glycine betaine/proline transport system ATP-binding protein
LDAKRHFQGVVSVESLKGVLKEKGDQGKVEDAYLPEAQAVDVDSSMQEIIPYLTDTPWPVPVTNQENVYLGCISKNMFLETLYRIEPAEAEEEVETTS